MIKGKFNLNFLRLLLLMIITVTVFITSICSSLAVGLEEIESQISNQEYQKTEIDKQLASLKNQIEEQKKSDSAITSEMAAVLKQKQQEKDKLNQMIEDLDYIYKQIDEYYETIQQAEISYNEALSKFFTRTKIMYQYSDYNLLKLFVESKDYFDFVNREKLFLKMMENDKKDLEELLIMKSDLENKKKIQEQFMLDTELLIAEKNAVIEAIENNEKDIYAKLEASREAIDILEAQEQAMIKESENIKNKIQELEKQYSDNSYSDSGLIWPSRSSTYISSYYGWRDVHPIYGNGRMHNGIDISAAHGTDIIASADGAVSLVLHDEDGYGWYIVLYHGDGISTLYAHCSKVIVKEGQTVKQGQVIGLVGTTGASTGPHIHYEVRVNGTPKNPLEFISPK